MKITFLGVGEACDQQFVNTSVLITAANSCQLMLDCGFSIPHRYFSLFDDPEKPDAVWISHFHGDHFFGMPLLLLRLWEMGRTKPLTIISQHGVEEKIISLMDTAYKGFSRKLQYPLEFKELEPGEKIQFKNLTMQAAQTVHSERNLGLLVEENDKKIYYSGDGRPSEQAIKLINNCDLIIHESFKMVDDIPNHGSIESNLKLLKQTNSRQLALVHLERKFRREQINKINTLLKNQPNISLPEDGTHLEI